MTGGGGDPAKKSIAFRFTLVLQPVMPYLFRAIQWLLQVAPTVISPPPVIARLVPGNPVAIASSTYRHFTSTRLAPAPIRIKEGGAPSRRHSPRPSPRRRWGLGRGESSGSCK